jgi:putative ABC transport system substrate-binding protein
MFRQGLKDASYIEGENVAIVYRGAEGHVDRLPALAAELASKNVGVIAAANNASALAAKAATATIPIVFAVGEDPVSLGLITSLAGPGGNATGATFLAGELVAKRLELLRELVPAATRVAVLVNPTNPNAQSALREVEPAARSLGLQIQVLNASTNREVDAAFATLVREQPDVLFVSPDGFFNSRRVQLVNLTSRHAIPAIYASRETAEVGGLMSYGTSIAAAYRQPASIPDASSMALGPQTCRWYRRASSSSSSMPEPPGCST